jgi:hypothetical protein
LTDALKRINVERREKEAALAAMNRALTDLNRERERSRKNIVSRVQAERRAAACQEEVLGVQGAVQAVTQRFDGVVAGLEARVAALQAEAVAQAEERTALGRARDDALETAADLGRRVTDLEVGGCLRRKGGVGVGG